jgi:hypothetical protein
LDRVNNDSLASYGRLCKCIASFPKLQFFRCSGHNSLIVNLPHLVDSANSALQEIYFLGYCNYTTTDTTSKTFGEAYPGKQRKLKHLFMRYSRIVLTTLTYITNS